MAGGRCEDEGKSVTIRQPFTIYSIDDFASWREHYAYPVSCDMNVQLDKHLSATLLDLYRTVPPEARPHYRIASKPLFYEAFDLILKVLVAEGYRAQKGVEYFLDNHNIPRGAVVPERNTTFEIYQGVHNPEYRYLELQYDDRPYLRIPFRDRWRNRIGDLLKGRDPFFSSAGSVLLMLPNDCVETYVGTHGLRGVRYLRPHRIFRRRSPFEATAGLEGAFHAIAESITEAIPHLYSSLGGETFPGAILNSVCHRIPLLLRRVEDDLQQARAYARKLPAKSELYTGTAKHYVRVMAEAIRERGGRVTGFPHGGALCLYELACLAFTEFATSDRFACFGEADAACCRQVSTLAPVEFPVFPEMGASPLAVGSCAIGRGETIRLGPDASIMYVFCNLYYDTYGMATRSDTQCLDFQLRALEFLLTLERPVLFKNRPKTATLGPAFNHFGYFASNTRLQYMNEPFTEVLHKADLFVFEGVGGGSLYEAMTLTDKPILLFKPNAPQCSPAFEAALEKRCHVIPLRQDERNRYVFDASAVRQLFEDGG